ncbi:unnamed protein product [Phytomonas sp. EM1]|nr:unnamed protein product [Phytomonas sp. EM1]|eukprot:CCW64251.1 unnamed protein product [Phytomonas sp. isolate EM1]
MESPGFTPAIDAAMQQETLRSWASAARQAEAFYHHVSDPQRRAYLDKIAAITRRNAQRNRQNRLRALEEARRLQPGGGLSESGGLWITDDAQRAAKAALYKAEKEAHDGLVKAAGDGGGNKKGKDEATSDGAPFARPSPEEERLEAFARKHREQTIRFDDVPEEWFTEGEKEGTNGAEKTNGEEKEDERAAEKRGAMRPRQGNPNRLIACADDCAGVLKRRRLTSLLLHASLSRIA